jgi:hypothetical protein
LHYQDIGEIDWLKVLQTDAVTIVIPPITIRELNEKKDSHSGKRVKRRAGETLKKLNTLFASASQAQLKAGITIHLEDRDPLIDFRSHQLNQDIQDDHLLASIIMCRDETKDSEIILVTADSGLTLLGKARRLGITTTNLPEEYKLPDEPDPDQEHNRELELENKELKSKIPRLSLTFKDGKQLAEFILSNPVELTQADIDTKIDSLQNSHPKIDLQSRSDVPALRSLLIGDVITPEDISKYNAELDEFYQGYVSHLQNENRFQNLLCRTIELEIQVVNEGNTPADDIDIFIQFPKGLAIVRKEKFPQRPTSPEPPTPPKPPWKMWAWPVELPGISSLFSNTSNLPPPNVSSPNVMNRTNYYEVNVKVKRIKHGLPETFDTFYATFNSFDDASSFHTDYRIFAANIPTPTTGQLHVIIRK